MDYSVIYLLILIIGFVFYQLRESDRKLSDLRADLIKKGFAKWSVYDDGKIRFVVLNRDGFARQMLAGIDDELLVKVMNAENEKEGPMQKAPGNFS